jgi:hypothetical protein
LTVQGSLCFATVADCAFFVNSRGHRTLVASKTQTAPQARENVICNDYVNSDRDTLGRFARPPGTIPLD